MRLWLEYYDAFWEKDWKGEIWPLSTFEKGMVFRATIDVRTEIDRLEDLEQGRALYLAAAAHNRYVADLDLARRANYDEPDAVSGGGLLDRPTWMGYTEVSDEPECSGHNPLTMLNWRVEDGGGAYGLC